MNYLHLSDVHFGLKQLTSEEAMKNFCEQTYEIASRYGYLPIDNVFVTGDLKYAKGNQVYPSTIVEFFSELKTSFSISNSQLFITPGNHDVNKDAYKREERIEDIKKDYIPQTREISDDLYNKIKKQGDYKGFCKIYKDIIGIEFKLQPFIRSNSTVNVIHVNTPLVSYDSKTDQGQLIVDVKKVNSLCEVKNDLPTFVIGHHPISWLTRKEKEEFEKLMQRYDIFMYLCGHEHVARFFPYQEIAASSIFEFICGTGEAMEEDGSLTEMDIFFGYLGDARSGKVTAVKWSMRNEMWMPDSEFSYADEYHSLSGTRHYPKPIMNTYEIIERIKKYPGIMFDSKAICSYFKENDLVFCQKDVENIIIRLADNGDITPRGQGFFSK